MAAGYLFDLADDLLTAALAGLAEVRTGHAPPGRVYVSHGTPAVDGICDEQDGQLTVHIGGPVTAVDHLAPNAQIGGHDVCAVVPQANLLIQLWRCWPTVAPNPSPTSDNAPETATLSAAARSLLIDLWAMLRHLHALRATGDLFTGVECNDVRFGPVVALNAQGGAAGWQVQVSAKTNDIGTIGS